MWIKRILSIILMLKLISSDENYYDILGVPRNADQQQIRKAFRRLS